MQRYGHRIARWAVPAATMALVFLPVCALAAQNPAAQPQGKAQDEIIRTIYLHHVAGRNDLSDITTALRSALRRSMFYGEESQNAIVFRGTPDEFDTAQKIVADLDRPSPAYRLTYTITDMAGGKPAGTRKFEFTALAGQKLLFTQGDRVPIVTGKEGSGSADNNSQVTYVDVGTKITATLRITAGSLDLQSELEQSAVAQESAHPQDPVFHQTLLNSAATLTPGKPQVLGSIDVPSTAGHEQIEVEAEAIGH